MIGRRRRDDDSGDDRRAQADRRGDGWADEARSAWADQDRDDPGGDRGIDFTDWYAGSGQRQGGRGDYPQDSQGQRDRYQGRREHYRDPEDRYHGQRGRYPDDQDRYGADQDRYGAEQDRYVAEQDRYGDPRGYAGQGGHRGSRHAGPSFESFDDPASRGGSRRDAFEEYPPAVSAPPASNGRSSGRPYGRLSIFTLLDDRAAEFDEVAERAAEAVRAMEPDTLVYVLHVVPKAPMQRIIYEIYRNRGAFEAHERQPHIRKFVADRADLVLATNIIDLRLKYAKVAPLGGSSAPAGEQAPPRAAAPRPVAPPAAAPRPAAPRPAAPRRPPRALDPGGGDRYQRQAGAGSGRYADGGGWQDGQPTDNRRSQYPDRRYEGD
jgi:quinol monooxygenase YgiN